MFIAFISFLYIWLADFKNTGGNKKERAVFLTVYSLSLALAVLILSGFDTVSPVKEIENLMDLFNISY